MNRISPFTGLEKEYSEGLETMATLKFQVRFHYRLRLEV